MANKYHSNLTGADLHEPKAHKSSHEAGGSDAISEKGNWTPDLTFGGAKVGLTYYSVSAEYTKDGAGRVTANAYIALSSKGSSVGDAVVGGLPFVLSGTNVPVTVSFTRISFADQLTMYASSGLVTMPIRETTNAGVNTAITNADFADDSAILISITYNV